MKWNELNWIELNRIESKCIKLNWIESNRVESKRIELNWNPLAAASSCIYTDQCSLCTKRFFIRFLTWFFKFYQNKCFTKNLLSYESKTVRKILQRILSNILWKIAWKRFVACSKRFMLVTESWPRSFCWTQGSHQISIPIIACSYVNSHGEHCKLTSRVLGGTFCSRQRFWCTQTSYESIIFFFI